MNQRKISLSTVYLRVVRRLHMIPVLALLAPFLCALLDYSLARGGEAAEHSLLRVYLISLLLVIPAALLHLAEMLLKRLSLYVLGGVMIIALGTAGFSAVCSHAGGPAAGPGTAAALAALILVFFDALQIHNNDNRRRIAKLEEDPSWEGDIYLLPQPTFLVLIWFAVIYVISLFIHSEGLGTAALSGSVLYFFLVFPYLVLKGLEYYLENRRHVSSIPLEGIRRLHSRTIPAVLIPCGLVAAVSILSAGGRRFLDLPVFPPMEEALFGNDMMMELWIRERMEMLNLLEEGAPPPAWLLTALAWIENALTLLAFLVILRFVVFLLLAAARRFGLILPETSGDSAREDRDEHVSLRPAARPVSREEAGVRRRYRRTILRAMGKAPEISETPDEMERLANLQGTEQTKALHEEYERVRYGAEPTV